MLADATSVVAYADDRRRSWHHWLCGREADLTFRDPDVTSPRGSVSFANLLGSQRWHAAFHYRQLLVFLDSRGHDVTSALSLGTPPVRRIPEQRAGVATRAVSFEGAVRLPRLQQWRRVKRKPGRR